MAKVTWLGDEDPSAQRIVHNGVTFVKGVPADVDEAGMAKVRDNPTFSVEKDAEPVAAIEPEPADPEEGTEKASIKQMLRDAGEDVKGNPSLETLRARLAKLTSPDAA